MSKEPLLIIGTIVVALNAFQTSALSLPVWAHAVIGAVSAGLGFIIARAQVTPSKAPAHSTAHKRVR